MRLHSILIFVVLMGLMLSSCNLTSNNQAGVHIKANFTAAAQAVEAKLTGLPLLPNQVVAATANTPADAIPTLEPFPNQADTPAPLDDSTATSVPNATITPAPTEILTPTVTNSPVPTQVCDAARFVADVTFPDGAIVKTNEFFTKTWRFKNIGTCTWDSSYALVFDVGDQMGGPTSVPLPVNVAPGEEVELSVDLQAPAKSGSYRSFWRLRNPGGIMLPIMGGYKSKSFYVDIRVKDNVNNNFAVVREFAVSGVDFIVTRSGSCAAGVYNVAAKVRATAPGEVSYRWKRSDGTRAPLSDGKIVFTAAGTQTIIYDWPTGATGISVTLSVLTPTERDFGPALLNCSP